MTPSSLLEGLASAWSATLFHATWQGVAAAGLAYVLRAGARDARQRHLAALIGLLAFVAVTLATFLCALSFTVIGNGPAYAGAHVQPSAGETSWTWWLLVAWAVGAGFMLARLAVGRSTLAAWQRSARTLEEEWQERVRVWCEKLGLGRVVRVLISDRTVRPLVVGWIRPVILLPQAALSGLTPAQLETIVVHELVHLRRRDHLVNMLQSLTEALFFFHPAIWWIGRVLRTEREFCCDDAVVALSANPRVYARALVELESQRQTAHPAALAATGGDLMTRVRRIVGIEDAAPRRSAVSIVACAGLAAVVFFVVLLGAYAGGDATGEGNLTISWLPESITQWSEEIELAGERHGIDPNLIAIVALVESGGDPDARSTSGAAGVMQIMPRTGEKIAEQRGLSDHTEERLFDPAYNFDFGAWYLAQMFSQFGQGKPSDEAVIHTVAAYNGGPHAMHAHLAEGRSLSDETRHYTHLIAKLWSERTAAESPTFEGLISRRQQSTAR